MNKQTKQPDTCTLCGSMSLRLLNDRSTHKPILSPDGMKIYCCDKCKCMSNEYELTTTATGTTATGTLGEPTTKREALKLALLLSITAPEEESEKREQCIQWAEKLAQELGEEVTESVKAELITSNLRG